MDRKLLEAVMMTAMFGPIHRPAEQTVRLKNTLTHTKNHFGSLEDIAGKVLTLIERNKHGDCLCVFGQGADKYIVDVDHRDIV